MLTLYGKNLSPASCRPTIRGLSQFAGVRLLCLEGVVERGIRLLEFRTDSITHAPAEDFPPTSELWDPLVRQGLCVSPACSTDVAFFVTQISRRRNSPSTEVSENRASV
jgi:hypothetical protein